MPKLEKSSPTSDNFTPPPNTEDTPIPSNLDVKPETPEAKTPSPPINIPKVEKQEENQPPPITGKPENPDDPENILVKPDIDFFLPEEKGVDPLAPENIPNPEESGNYEENPDPANNPPKKEESGENNHQTLRCVHIDRLTSEIMEVDLTLCDDPSHVDLPRTILDLRQQVLSLSNELENKIKKNTRIKIKYYKFRRIHRKRKARKD